jgi:hypothetical protein
MLQWNNIKYIPNFCLSSNFLICATVSGAPGFLLTVLPDLLRAQIRIKRISYTFYTVNFYTLQFYTDKILYSSKFIRFKVYKFNFYTV